MLNMEVKSVESPFYAGTFAPKKGSPGIINVKQWRDLSTDAVWTQVKSPRAVFPKTGQVEIASAPSASEKYRRDEWYVFKVVPSSRPGDKTFRAVSCIPVTPYIDLAGLGSVEAARVSLTSKGLKGNYVSGKVVIRVSDSVVLQCRIKERQGRIFIDPEFSSQIEQFDFDPRCLLEQTKSRENWWVLTEPVTPLLHDWSSECDHIERVVRSLEKNDIKCLEKILGYLDAHRRQDANVFPVPESQSLAAEAALRSGALADRIGADLRVRRLYLEAATQDGKVAAQLALAIKEAAAQARESERAKLLEQVTIEVEREKEQLLRVQEQALQLHKKELEDEILSEMTERGKLLEEQLLATVAAKSREAEDLALAEYEAARLQRELVETETSSLMESLAAKDAHLTALAARQFEMTNQIEELRAEAGELSKLVEPSCLSASGRYVERYRLLSPGQVYKAIQAQPFLTKKGKEISAKLIALLLAGEVPILEGHETRDFIKVIECLIAPERVVHIHCDPTLIAYEDLWAKPASKIRSAFSLAETLAVRQNRTVIVVLEDIDVSGARFWYPALAATAQRGLLPRHLLIMATIRDSHSEEARSLPASTTILTLDDVISTQLATAFPAFYYSSLREKNLIDPGDWTPDVSESMQYLQRLKLAVSLTDSTRLVRIASEAARFLIKPQEQVPVLIEQIVSSWSREDEGQGQHIA